MPGTVLEALPTPSILKHLPGNHTQQLRIKAPIASNCVCEHLCFILIYVVCPLARHDLRQLIFRRPFWLRKCFTGTFHFLKAGETYIHRKRKATEKERQIANCGKMLNHGNSRHSNPNSIDRHFSTNKLAKYIL